MLTKKQFAIVYIMVIVPSLIAVTVASYYIEKYFYAKTCIISPDQSLLENQIGLLSLIVTVVTFFGVFIGIFSWQNIESKIEIVVNNKMSELKTELNDTVPGKGIESERNTPNFTNVEL